jgi:nicotinate-nucleotide pyrophosphorylase (carboxylating)
MEKYLTKKYIREIVRLALSEDIANGDITAKLIPKTKKISAYILTREAAIISGTRFVDEVFHQLNRQIKIEWLVKDKDRVRPKQILCYIKGPTHALLSGERTALNFLQMLSGTATLTDQFVKAIRKQKAKILDTRKTIPGLRLAQKYAVTCGGGKNHRLGLYDAILLKENHIASFSTSRVNAIHIAIKMARNENPRKIIEIEVRNLRELHAALNAKADIIMLDNFNLINIQKAVTINAGLTKLEVSGDVNLNNVDKIAKTGVDYISVGALTKNVRAINLSMLFLNRK